MSTTILGAGPIGLALAYEIAKRGEEVIVISTSRNTGKAAEVNAGWIVPIMAAPVPAPGMVKKSLGWMLKKESPLKISMFPRPSHVSFMAQMLRNTSQRHFAHGLHALSEFGRGTLESFDKYQAEGVDFELHKTGLLMAFLSEKELDAHFAEFENSDLRGLKKVISLSGEEMREIEPGLSRAVKAGINCSDQYSVNPTSLLVGLANACKKLGVKIHETVSPIYIKEDRIKAIELAYDNVRFPTDHVIIAAGVESRKLMNQVGFDLPLKFGKGYCLDFPQESRISNALYLSEAKVAVTPMEGFLRLAGTMEFGGAALKISQQRANGILKSSSDYFSFSIKEQRNLGMGLRPMTPDGMPVIGKVPNTSNIYVATGHAMLGVTLAPATAKVLANFIFSQTESEHLLNFSPSRFQ
ncbi:MAG TPA: FAD-dependent oxidoreductase [Candidatus Nanopelagicaceae bacterium]